MKVKFVPWKFQAWMKILLPLSDTSQKSLLLTFCNSCINPISLLWVSSRKSLWILFASSFFPETVNEDEQATTFNLEQGRKRQG
jgi:hypothetical protein